MRTLFVTTIVVAFALAACDRKVEPFDPDEQPSEPDLSRIFPAGAEQADIRAPAVPPPPPGARQGLAPPVAAEAGAPIQGTLTLAGELEGRVPEAGILFLIARASEAGPPLAVVRVPGPRFPMDFSIGPENRMIQSMPFAGPLRITARVDSDGNAMTRTPGDLAGAAEGTYEPGATGVSVRIDQVL